MNAVLSATELAVMDHAIAADLAPLATAIDEEGVYPEAFVRQLGRLGAFGGATDGHDLARSIELGARVGRVCGSTAFIVWCQSTSAWYLAHAPEHTAREKYLARVASGELLAGSGMSNTLKHLDGIERSYLRARREGDHYLVDGVLPWVSNLGPDHLVLTAAAVEGGGYLMFAARCGAAEATLRACPAFAGMEGTGTFAVRFRNLVVGADQVLAHPAQFDAFMARIKPGLILNQAGMGFGVIEGCLDILREGGGERISTNAYVPGQAEELGPALRALRQAAQPLIREAEAGTSAILPVLKLRAAVSELALRAANAAVLHAGARGYLKHHPAQRRLREAVFVAIVSPALKHLRKAIHDLEQRELQAEAA